MSTSSIPIDEASNAALARSGLVARLVDTGDTAAFGAWIRAQARGFYESDPRGDEMERLVARMAHRRTVGVYEQDADAEPVGTVSSWVAPLTTPGGRVSSWPISSVTVSPTHRRRGIARALLEGELRAAATSGIPVATLTASEATIYGRYGFGPATFCHDLTIDTRRARLSAETTSRVRFTTPAELHAEGTGVYERACERTPGQLLPDADMWARSAGVVDSHDSTKPTVRAVRCDDESGLVGYATYRVTENESDNTANRCDVLSLVAATDDAYTALWSFVLNLDLVGTVAAYIRSVDEPLRWQLGDTRALRVTHEGDLLWARILDPASALTARTYDGPGALRLSITDALGFAEGTFLLTSDDRGSAAVRRVDADAPDPADASVPHVELPVGELSSLYLGGVSALTLARAGRIVEHSEGAAREMDRLFRSPVAPWLGMWF